jgi:hypothetical protein
MPTTLEYLAEATESAQMPTHRDYPWERDQRAADRPIGRPSTVGRSARRGRSVRQPVSRVQVLAVTGCLAATAALTLPGRVSAPAAGITGQAQPPAQPHVPPSVSALRTRFLDSQALHVWGRTTAPGSASIALRIATVGTTPLTLTVRVRAVAGRFSTTAPIPAAMRGRSLRVSAAVAR